ncbi:MAG: hypothetical protein P8Y26_02385 [Gemmatimonadales bacterium]
MRSRDGRSRSWREMSSATGSSIATAAMLFMKADTIAVASMSRAVIRNGDSPANRMT